MPQRRPVVPDGLPVGGDRGCLAGGLWRVAQHGVGVVGLHGEVYQPGDIHPSSLGVRQHLQDPAVQVPAGQGRDRTLDRLPDLRLRDEGTRHQQTDREVHQPL